MVIDFLRVRHLKLENEDDGDDIVVLFAGRAKPVELDGVDIDCYKVSYADMVLIRDAFKR